MTPKLKPCPFCGGEAYADYGYYGAYAHKKYFFVKCSACKTKSGVDFKNKTEAIKAWNRRAEK